MSHEIPAISFLVNENQAFAGMDSDEALALAPPDVDLLWMSTSRNWWYQGLLEDVLAVYPEFDDVSYLLRDLALIPSQQTLGRARQIRKLLEAIRSRPAAFAQIVHCTDQEVCQQVGEAEVSRNLSDDSRIAGANFFSFLLSNAAALEEASQSGKALLYVQPRPEKSPERL